MKIYLPVTLSLTENEANMFYALVRSIGFATNDGAASIIFSVGLDHYLRRHGLGDYANHIEKTKS
jgi:hypothetical protein